MFVGFSFVGVGVLDDPRRIIIDERHSTGESDCTL